MIAYYGLKFHPDWIYIQETSTNKCYKFIRKLPNSEGGNLSYQRMDCEECKNVVFTSSQIIKNLYRDIFRLLTKEEVFEMFPDKNL